MPIKAPVKYHLIPVIKKSTNNKYQRGYGEKRILVHNWWNVNWCSHYITVCHFLKKLKIELPYDPAIPLLVIYLEKNKNAN